MYVYMVSYEWKKKTMQFTQDNASTRIFSHKIKTFVELKNWEKKLSKFFVST